MKMQLNKTMVDATQGYTRCGLHAERGPPTRNFQDVLVPEEQRQGGQARTVMAFDRKVSTY